MDNDSENIEYPEVPQTHITQEIGQRVLKNSLPPSWTVEQTIKDYGIDYDVEVTEGKSKKGLGFKVQLKGSEEFVFGKDDRIHVKLKARTINYWINHFGPVMIVCADVENNKIYYSWLEDAYKEYPNPVIGQDHKTLYIEKNDLSKSDEQTKIIKYLSEKKSSELEAEKRTKKISLFSGESKQNIRNLIAKMPDLTSYQKLINSTHPDYEISDISISEDNIKASIKYKKNDIVKFIIKDAKDGTFAEKFKNLIEQGDAISLNADELIIGNNDIDRMKELLFPNVKFDTVTLSPYVQPHKKLPVIVEVVDKNNQQKASVGMHFDIQKMGSKKISLIIEQDGFPIKFYFVIDRIDANNKGKFNCDCQFMNHPLKAVLKGMKILRILYSGAVIKVMSSTDDSQFLQTTTQSESESEVALIGRTIEYVESLIKISEKFGVELPYDEKPDIESLNNIKIALYLIEKREIEYSLNEVEMVTQKDGIKSMIASFHENGIISIGLCVENEQYPLRILGKEIIFGKTKLIFPQLKPKLSIVELSKIEKLLKPGENHTLILIPHDDIHNKVKVKLG